MAAQQLALGLPPDMQQSFDQMTPERRQEWFAFLANFDRKEKRRHNRLRKQWFADFGEDVGPFTSTYEWFWEGYRFQIAQAVRSGEYTMLGLDASEQLTKRAVTNAYRRMARKLHPDKGGDPEAFKAMYAAYRKLLTIAKD